MSFYFVDCKKSLLMKLFPIVDDREIEQENWKAIHEMMMVSEQI